MSENLSMHETLEIIKEETDGEKITIGNIVEALKNKGFGALLIAPTLITILPTGAIPGIPAICGLFIILIALQILFSRKHPWLPTYLKEFSFSRKKYNDAIKNAKPYVKKIDRFFYPRIEIFTQEASQKIAAIFCIFLSVGMIAIGFIPMLPAIFSISILAFGIGFAARDGLLILSGFVLAAIICIIAPFMV